MGITNCRSNQGAWRTPHKAMYNISICLEIAKNYIQKFQLTLHEAAASEMHTGRGTLNGCPYKNPFRRIFVSIVSHNLNWGNEITLETFFKIMFIAKNKKIPFLHTFSLTSRNSCFT